ncbi:jacalin-like lectin [Terriglobus roseus]|nr:jacalin-like lectin [Terriglobus roseus]
MKLTIVPRPSGQSLTIPFVDETALASMTLAALRVQLLAEKILTHDAVFLDQGVPVLDRGTNIADNTREDNTLVTEIVVAGPSGPCIEIMSLDKSKELFLYEDWKDDLPIVEASSHVLSLKASAPAGGQPPAASGTDLNVRHAAAPVATSEELETQMLSADEMQTLLQNCGLYPIPLGKATCAALRFGKEDVEFGNERILTCGKVQILSAQQTREDRVCCSFQREAEMWETQLTERTNLGLNMPLLFGIEAASEAKESNHRFQSGESVHLGRVLALPKLEVVLEGLALSPHFVDRIRTVVETGNAVKLLDLLAVSGLFVATHFLVGAKIVARSSKRLVKTTAKNDLKAGFRSATSGLFTTEHTLSTGRAAERTVTSGGETISVKTIGGFGEHSSSTAGKEGGQEWLLSVATEPLWWRVIGFKGEIRTILDYLPVDVQANTQRLLRQYFENRCILKESAMVGGDGGERWTDKQFVNLHTRISGFDTRMNQTIDSVRFRYQNKRAKRCGLWHGWSLEQESSYTFDPRDEIVALEVGWDRTLDHLIFHTRKGDNKASSVGRAKGAKRTHIFKHPRIRGFYGRAGKFPDALGVLYYDLHPDLPHAHRQILLSLEQTLFEDQ